MEHTNTDVHSQYGLKDKNGETHQIDLRITDYRAAGEAGVSLSEYLTAKFPEYDIRLGTPMEQIMAQTGMYLRPDKGGIRPPSMKQVLDGSLDMNVGTIVRPDGTGNNTPSGRLLFPEIILQLIESQLDEDKSDFVNGYNSMVAQTQTVTSPKIEQPIINTQAPRSADVANQPVAQLAEPARMVTITVSDKTYRVPTKSIGLTISDEALQASTLDLVGLAMTHQARAERIRIIEDNITNMVNGDTDIGETALSSVQADSFDAAIVAAGVMSQKAWIHYLRAAYQTRTITHILCDVNAALALEGRTGKPNVQGDDPKSPRIDTLFSVENLGISPPKILLLETALIGANTVVGLDAQYAIRRIVNVSASYSAIEQYVMRKATGFRVDYGEMSHKLFSDAWSKMTMTV